jgi:hypothetical protein
MQPKTSYVSVWDIRPQLRESPGFSCGEDVKDIHRQHLSEAHKGYCPTAETRAKTSATLQGRASVPQHSEESKAKMSAAHKVIQSQRVKQPMAGKHHSEETKAKMSAAKKGKPKSEETKQRMRDAQARRREARVLATEPMG